MIRNEKITPDIVKRIGKFIRNKKISDIVEISLCEGITSSLIYPTDDHLLYECQLSAVVKLLEEHESLYALQLGWSDVLGADTNELFILSPPFNEEYYNLDLSTFTLLFSNSYQWLVLIDEAQEGGVGLIVGEKDIIEKFDSIYGRTKQDIVSFVNFHLDEEKRRSRTLTILPKIIKILAH